MGPGPASSRSNEQKQQNERRWREWVRGELASGVTPLALTAQLVKRGWPRERATLLISSNHDAFRPTQAVPASPGAPQMSPPRSHSIWPAILMLLGALIVLAGAGFLAHSIILPTHRGPLPIVWWSAIGGGALLFFLGLIVSFRSRR